MDSEPLDGSSAALRQVRRSLVTLLEARIEQQAGRSLGPWLGRLTSLKERELRRHRIVEILGRSCDHLAFVVVRHLWTAGQAGDILARELLVDLLQWRPLTEVLGYDKVRDLYARAMAHDEPHIGRLFLTSAARQGLLAYPGSKVENRAMIDVSLGVRKALARGRDRFKLDRLMFDLNPAVIHNLLNNPRTVELDVVRIAAQRPTNGEVLQEIFQHPRWGTRYAVKKAIVFNEYAPIDMSLVLLSHMLHHDIEAVAQSSLLSEELIQAAGGLLRRRRA